MWKNFSPGFERVESRLGMVVLTYNLSYSEGGDRKIEV
jgi:hypothetical protein